MVPSRLLKHEMHVCRPPRMSLQQLQELSHWPIMRNRVRHRNNSLEPKHTILVTPHHTSAIWSIPHRMLYVIMSCTICLPDIDLHAFNRVPLHVFDGAEYETGIALRIVRHVVSMLHILRFMSVEWTEDRSFCARRWFGVVNCIDEEGKAKNIGKEDKFLQDSSINFII